MNGNCMLIDALILEGGAMVMTLHQNVGNYCCLESTNGIRYTDPAF